MRFLPEPREEKGKFLLATVQGPHQSPGNTSSIFHSSCHWDKIFSWFLPLQVHVLHSIHSASCSGRSNDIYSSWAIPGEENDGLKLRSYFADPCVLNFLEWQKTILASTLCCLSSLTKLSDWEGKLVQKKMPRDNSQDLCQDHVWQKGGWMLLAVKNWSWWVGVEARYAVWDSWWDALCSAPSDVCPLDGCCVPVSREAELRSGKKAFVCLAEWQCQGCSSWICQQWMLQVLGVLSKACYNSRRHWVAPDSGWTEIKGAGMLSCITPLH